MSDLSWTGGLLKGEQSVSGAPSAHTAGILAIRTFVRIPHPPQGTPSPNQEPRPVVSSTPAPSHAPGPLHAVQVLGGGGAGTGGHARSLAAGLVARGLRVTVCAPRGAELSHRFTDVGAQFAPAGVTPSARPEAAAVSVLRSVCADADLVHAHGLRAAALALSAVRGRRRRIPFVVSWHRRPEPEGIRAPLMRLLERGVMHEADVVLGATSDLVQLARRRGARDARLAPVALPAPRCTAQAECDQQRNKIRAELGTVGRPLLLAVGRLSADQGYRTLLTASRAWARLDPQPLLAIAGEGPERAALQRRIDAEDLPVRLLGRRSDALDLLPAADAAVFSGRWEARSLLAQEALQAGVPLVATAVGGIPELVGDGALLIPYGDADALATAVSRLLSDPGARAELAAAGRAQAAHWPTEDDTVAQVLSVYDELESSAAGAG